MYILSKKFKVERKNSKIEILKRILCKISLRLQGQRGHSAQLREEHHLHGAMEENQQ
jgi:hypothetical protein